MERWFIGVLLALLGCCSTAVGMVLMKHSTAVESELPFLQRRFFLLGFVFLIVNASVIDVVAFSLAPLSLIAPFSGITIVVTSMLASSGLLYVRETLDVNDAASTAITLIGVLLASVYGPHVDDGPRSTEELYGYFQRTEFALCMGCLFSILVLGWIVEAFLSSPRPQRQPPLLPTADGDPSAAAAATTAPRVRASRVLLFAYTAGLAGALSMLLLKVIGTGLLTAFEHHSAVLEWGWVLSLVGLACCASVQLGFLHRTLANSPVSYGVPTYQALLTVLTVLVGGIFFSEFDIMPPFDQLVFTVGVGVTLFGVALHSTHRSTATVDRQRTSLLASAKAGTASSAARDSGAPPLEAAYGSRGTAGTADRDLSPAPPLGEHSRLVST